MKISPVAQGTVPTLEQGDGRVSQGARERAKRAFKGEAQGTIVESDNYIDPTTQRQLDVKKIRMNTNASPDRYSQEGVTINDPIQEPLTSSETEETKPLSPQFAALAKQRRALQVKERELSEREAKLNTPSEGSFTKAQLKSETLRVLQEAGVTYDDLTQAILANSNGSPEVQELRAELRSTREDFNKTLADRDSQAEQQVLSEMMREAQRLVSTDDTFELVRETNSLPKVKDLIYRTYKDTGEVLDEVEALRLVEDELLTDAMKLANSKKIREKFQPVQSQPRMRTLTNRDTSQAPMTAKQRAIAAFQGKLK